MAESLAIALRAAFDPPEQLCNREPDFIELYAVLGDEAKQNEIRAASKVKHCGLLIKNPLGCHGCPFNPFESKDTETKRQAEAVWLLHENREPVELALWLEEQERMGMLMLSELTAPELEAVRVCREERERQQRRELGKLVGYEVAVIIGKMFSRQ